MSTLIESNAILSVDNGHDLLPPPGLPRGVRVTSVFNTYWKFAAERQQIFFRRLSGLPFPWTEDPTLRSHKFTNAYRASDRTSQFLINAVITAGRQSPSEIFFRVILFKLFNRIETWELLRKQIGEPQWSHYSFRRYDTALSNAMEARNTIYSAAYIMPSGGKADRKHRHHLRLLEKMMTDNLAGQLQNCHTMNQAFTLLRSYPSIGDFLAYQFVTDLNYSDLLDFKETEFVRVGPGAKDGIRKCFAEQGSWSADDLVSWVTETQEAQFQRLGINFRNLWGRPLQLIDCQNLFCEIDKYARRAHPEIASRRMRIKQRFHANTTKSNYRYPPKWGINDAVLKYGADWNANTEPNAFKVPD